jgi:hypothetical protein
MSDLFGVGGRKLLDELQLDAPYNARIGSLRRLIDAFTFEIDILTKRNSAELKTHPGFQAIQAGSLNRATRKSYVHCGLLASSRMEATPFVQQPRTFQPNGKTGPGYPSHPVARATAMPRDPPPTATTRPQRPSRGRLRRGRDVWRLDVLPLGRSVVLNTAATGSRGGGRHCGARACRGDAGVSGSSVGES